MKDYKLLIHTSWKTYILMFIFPIALVLLDYVSSIMTKSNFSGGILNVAILIFACCVIFGTRIVIVSNKNLYYWPHFIVGKKIKIDEIHKIEVNIEDIGTDFTVAPLPVVYFLSGENKPSRIGRVVLRTFSKNDISNLFKIINELNPNIIFDEEVKSLVVGDWKSINQKENIMWFYWNGIILLILVVFSLGLLSGLFLLN